LGKRAGEKCCLTSYNHRKDKRATDLKQLALMLKAKCFDQFGVIKMTITACVLFTTELVICKRYVVLWSHILLLF